MAHKVVDGVWWIPGRDRFLPDSHMYVIGQPDGEDFTLGDCGLMDMGSYKVSELDACGVSPNHVRRIIMTHTHLDHIGCLPEILEAIPHAEVWVHRDEAIPMERGDERIIHGNRMFESMVRSQYMLAKDLFKIHVHRKLEGGEELSLGGMAFRVIHIPGHSIGGIGLFNEEHRMLLSGDTVYADYAIGRFDLESADPDQLKRSLGIIDELGVEILLPCHNRIVKSGAAPMIKKTVELWGPQLAAGSPF